MAAKTQELDTKPFIRLAITQDNPQQLEEQLRLQSLSVNTYQQYYNHGCRRVDKKQQQRYAYPLLHCAFSRDAYDCVEWLVNQPGIDIWSPATGDFPHKGKPEGTVSLLKAFYENNRAGFYAFRAVLSDKTKYEEALELFGSTFKDMNQNGFKWRKQTINEVVIVAEKLQQLNEERNQIDVASIDYWKKSMEIGNIWFAHLSTDFEAEPPPTVGKPFFNSKAFGYYNEAIQAIASIDWQETIEDGTAQCLEQALEDYQNILKRLAQLAKHSYNTRFKSTLFTSEETACKSEFYIPRTKATLTAIRLSPPCRLPEPHKTLLESLQAHLEKAKQYQHLYQNLAKYTARLKVLEGKNWEGKVGHSKHITKIQAYAIECQTLLQRINDINAEVPENKHVSTTKYQALPVRIQQAIAIAEAQQQQLKSQLVTAQKHLEKLHAMDWSQMAQKTPIEILRQHLESCRDIFGRVEAFNQKLERSEDRLDMQKYNAIPCLIGAAIDVASQPPPYSQAELVGEERGKGSHNELRRRRKKPKQKNPPLPPPTP